MSRSEESFISKAEAAAEKLTSNSRLCLPVVARLCLVSSFLEDGWRMGAQWHDQRDYIAQTWQTSELVASLFVLFNLVGQLGAVALVLARLRVVMASTVLAAVVVVQTIGYNMMWDLQFLFRNFSLCGALLLLVAETRAESKALFAGVPSLWGDKRKSLLQLTGRLLLVFMFLALLKFDLKLGQVVQNLVGSLLITLVAVGYKTKLTSLILITWLNTINFYFNAWWTVPSHQPLRDFLKYDFFQTLSVVGGLLMVVVLGPGQASVDARKKEW